MLPLNKLQRFAKRAAPPAQPPAPAAPAEKELPKLPPAPALTQAQLIAMANPRSFACEHCKKKASEQVMVLYTENPSFKLWLCFDCWAHHAKHNVLPPVQPPRALPVLLRKKS